MSTRTPFQAQFSIDIARLILALDQLGYQVITGEFYRPDETAELYERQGRGIKKSLHTVCLAADLPLIKDGKYLTLTEDYEEAGRLWEAMGEDHNWGGHFGDGNHFSKSYPHEGFEGVK